MTHQSFNRLLRRAVLLPAILLALLSIGLLWQFSRLKEAGGWVLHTDQVVDETRLLRSYLLDMETGMRGFLLYGNTQFLEPYDIARPLVAPSLARIKALASTKPLQLSRLAVLDKHIKTWIEYTDTQINPNRKATLDANPLITQDQHGKVTMDGLRKEILEFLSEEKSIQAGRVSQFEADEKLLIDVFILATIVLGATIAIFGRPQLRFLSRRYEQALRSEADRQVQMVFAHKKLQEHVAELESERSIREIFVSTLSYDLRNPLGVIQMSADLLMTNPEEEAEQKAVFMKMIFNAASRANRMIENLLDANRIKVGEAIPLQIEHQDLRVVATELVDDLKLVYANLISIIGPAVDFGGWWSADCIRRMLENLCTNAMKYGTRDALVTVTLRKPAGHVEFAVHNEGQPLSAEEQTKLFEPFQRSRSAQASGQQGWGLGLTLVKNLAEAHGGHVRVESGIGLGTTFIVCLPDDARNFSTARHSG